MFMIGLSSLVPSQLKRQWGGGIMGAKAQAAKTKLDKAKSKELAAMM